MSRRRLTRSLFENWGSAHFIPNRMASAFNGFIFAQIQQGDDPMWLNESNELKPPPTWMLSHKMKHPSPFDGVSLGTLCSSPLFVMIWGTLGSESLRLARLGVVHWLVRVSSPLITNYKIIQKIEHLNLPLFWWQCEEKSNTFRTNPFLVESRHQLAITYNDKSPLENMHCAKLFGTPRKLLETMASLINQRWISSAAAGNSPQKNTNGRKKQQKWIDLQNSLLQERDFRMPAFGRFPSNTLQGTSMSHQNGSWKTSIPMAIPSLGSWKIIFKMPFLGDMLVPWRVIARPRFEICNEPNSNAFGKASKDVYKEARKVAVATILHTDNANHFAMIKDITQIYETHETWVFCGSWFWSIFFPRGWRLQLFERPFFVG